MIRKSYIVLLVLSSFFSSCSREIGEGTDPNAPVGLDARIAGVSLITRGGATEASGISSLGIYAVNKISSETTYGSAPAGTYCAYKISSGTASPNVENAPLWLCLDKAIIFSCHPAPAVPATITAGGTAAEPNPVVAIPADAIGLSRTGIAKTDVNIYDFADAAHDYMYGVAYDNSKSPETAKFLAKQPEADNGHTAAGDVVNSSGPKVAIGLKHAFAQIKLVISKGDYQGAAKITKVEYTRNMATLKDDGSTTMSLKNGVLANTADVADKTYSFGFAGDGVVPSTETPVTLINYVLPNTVPASNSKFAITVDGKTMEMEHSSDPAWEAGNIYAYTITINGTGLALTGFTVVGWKEESQPDIPTI